MSNYPNMSYCMCQNTVQAMQQIMNAMDDEGPLFLQEMSREERRAYEELFRLCESFIYRAEELQDEYEEGVREGHNVAVDED